MHPSKSWFATLAGLLLLASCGTSKPPVAASPPKTVEAAGPVCRTAPGGGPLEADRGIGGTGSPSVRLADKEIGGTGIVGVITGFASICVGGREVAYDPALPVAVDNHAATPSDLRAGQVAAVEASGPRTALQARHVSIRHEVVGPIEAQDSANRLRIAGQPVLLAPSTLGDQDLQPGAWIAVSGFRDADGLIHATRIDRQPASEVELHGLLRREGRFWRIGTLEIRFDRDLAPIPDSLVLVAGRYSDGILYAATVTPDVWNLSGPGIPAIFGPSVEFVIVETFAGDVDGRLVIGRSQRDRANTPFERAVIELQRRPDGSLQSFRTRTTTPPGVGPGGPASRGAGPPGERRFEPAPVPGTMPNHGMGLDRGPGTDGRAGLPLDRSGARSPESGRGFPGAPSNPFPGGPPGRNR